MPNTHEHACVISTMEEIFEWNPTWRILGKRKLKALLKTHNIRVDAKQVDEYYAHHAAHQVFLKPPKTSQQFKITAPPYSYQIDVVVLPQYKKQNGGVDRFLLLVEVLSKKAFAFILKSNKMHDVIACYEQFLHDKRHTVCIAGDAFSTMQTSCASTSKDAYVSRHVWRSLNT